MAPAAQLVNQVPQERAHLVHQAAPEPQDILLEGGAAYLSSAVNFPDHTLTVIATLAFGAPAVSEESDMAMATAWDTEDTTQGLTDMAERSSQDMVYMALLTLAMAPLVVAMDTVCLVPEQAVLRLRCLRA